MRGGIRWFFSVALVGALVLSGGGDASWAQDTDEAAKKEKALAKEDFERDRDAGAYKFYEVGVGGIVGTRSTVVNFLEKELCYPVVSGHFHIVWTTPYRGCVVREEDAKDWVYGGKGWVYATEYNTLMKQYLDSSGQGLCPEGADLEGAIVELNGRLGDFVTYERKSTGVWVILLRGERMWKAWDKDFTCKALRKYKMFRTPLSVQVYENKNSSPAPYKLADEFVCKP